MILIAILLVGGAFLVAEYRNKQDSKLIYTGTTLSTSTDLQNYENAIDWKNILLAIDKTSSSTVKDITKKPEELTPFDILGRDFFARYMELRQMGNSADKLNQQDLINQTLRNVVLSKPKLYTSDEITVHADSSIPSIKQYGNNIAGIFKKYSINSRNEGVIARDAIQRDDSEILKELDPLIESYRNIVTAILKTPAPQTISAKHLDLLNGMNAALFVVQSFRKSGSDPIAGLQASSQYLPARQKILDAMNDIKIYLASLNITYSPSEPGNLFIPLK